MPIISDPPILEQLSTLADQTAIVVDKAAEEIAAQASVITDLEDQIADLQAKPLDAKIERTSDAIILTWVPIDGTTIYVTARDGVDNRGGGPISFVEAPTITSRRFIWLTASTTVVSVTALPSGVSQAVPITG